MSGRSVGFSFIIPTLGDKPQLRETLRGISELRDTGRGLEVVVVFDGVASRQWTSQLAAYAGDVSLAMLEQVPARAGAGQEPGCPARNR